jgi:hypothetical protein
MRNERVARILVVVLGAMFAPTGVQAALFPRSFHDDFPLGRGWLAAAGGHYDEHLVRDVGALFLALTVLSIWAWWRPALCTPVSVAWLIQGIWHLGFHLGDLDGLEGFDRIGLLGSLITVPVVAAAALWADRPRT